MVIKTDFLGYIVSDKETAFPDGGEKGGYWYEKVVEGAKVATGSITNSMSSLTSLNIEHGLGEIPTKFAVIPSSFSGTGAANLKVTLTAFYDGTTCSLLSKNGSGTSGGTVTPTINDTNISIPSYNGSDYPWARGTYQWIAVAE